MLNSSFVTKLFWVATGAVAIIAGGEAILGLLEEVIDIIVETSQALFMFVFERGLDMPYEKAQGRAAWTSIGLLVLMGLIAAWRLAPWVKRKIGEMRQWYRAGVAELVSRWQTAKCYHKLFVVVVGLTLLFAFSLVV